MNRVLNVSSCEVLVNQCIVPKLMSLGGGLPSSYGVSVVEYDEICIITTLL